MGSSVYEKSPLVGAQASPSPDSPAEIAVNPPRKARTTIAIAGLSLVVLFFWAYWPTTAHLIHTWNTVPDYSHGFLVPLLAGFFLWHARDRFPDFRLQFAWPGLLLVLLSIAMRIPAAILYIPTIDAWSIPVWIVGVVWTFGGWRLARWSLPAALYLYFMVPLPFRMEQMLSLPLRSAATRLSVWTLQCLGQPAISEGYTIHLGTHRLDVEQACSGLRMLVGIIALAVAYLMFFKKSWWERALLLLSVVPVALAANTARIVVTGLCYQYISSEAGQKFSHDFAGFAMILMAAFLFGGVLWYLNRLFPERETMDVADLLLGQSEPQSRASKP